MTLDMTPYTAQASRKESDSTRGNPSYIYDLLTVVVHIGKMETGHYISYSKSQDGQVSGETQAFMKPYTIPRANAMFYAVVQVR